MYVQSTMSLDVCLCIFTAGALSEKLLAIKLHFSLLHWTLLFFLEGDIPLFKDCIYVCFDSNSCFLFSVTQCLLTDTQTWNYKFTLKIIAIYTCIIILNEITCYGTRYLA